MLGKIYKIIIIMLLCVTTFACSTTSQTTNKKMVATARVNTQLGLAYLQQGNIPLAKQKLLTALQQAPDVPDTWYSMAYFQEATGNAVEAESAYLKAISIAHDKGESENNYGTFLCRAGHYKTSIQHFMNAVQDPNYLNSASAYENAGLCALKIPDKQLARNYFTKAIQEDPNSSTSLLELAKLEYQTGNKTQAKEKLRLYLLIGPTTPDSNLLSKQLAMKEGTPRSSNTFAANTRQLKIVNVSRRIAWS